MGEQLPEHTCAHTQRALFPRDGMSVTDHEIMQQARPPHIYTQDFFGIAYPSSLGTPSHESGIHCPMLGVGGNECLLNGRDGALSDYGTILTQD